MTSILRYDAACAAIAEAKTVDEVTDWVDKAAAVREYGRRINNRQIEIDAIEIRVKAKRRRGEILAELKENGRLVSPRTARTIESSGNDLITLEQLGVSRNESSEDQRLAAIPGDSFVRLVARCREYAEAHPEKHSFDVLGENAATDKKQARENRERVLGVLQQALPDKKFGVILADPEWRFKTYSRETGMDRAADNHYPTSETDAICARPVGDIAATDCVLFLWATAPMLPDALRVMAAWGFEYKSHAIWKKDRIGTGYWLRNQHELLLIGTRGKIPAPAMGTQFASVIDAPLGDHSEKPDAFYEIIEAYFPTLPKIELNARRARTGWEAWGNEAPADPAAELPPHDLETGEVIEPAAVVDQVEASPQAFPPTEFADLAAIEKGLSQAVGDRLSEYARRGLAVDALKSWRLTRAGEIRLDVIERERKAREALCKQHLDQTEFWEWRDLTALAGGELDDASVRSLVGFDLAACTDDRNYLTHAGVARLAELEAIVDRALGVPVPAAPKQIDIEDLLGPPGGAPLDLPLFLPPGGNAA